MLRVSTPIPGCDGFLTAADVPANLLRVRPGERIRLTTPRCVRRVGYRLSATDFREEADRLMKDSEVSHNLIIAYRALTGVTPNWKKIRQLIAYDLARKAGLGGPERGIVVEPLVLTCALIVDSVRQVRLGSYYPPSNPTRRDYYDDEPEPGGLANPKTVVLLTTAHLELISGDCTRVVEEK